MKSSITTILAAASLSILKKYDSGSKSRMNEIDYIYSHDDPVIKSYSLWQLEITDPNTTVHEIEQFAMNTPELNHIEFLPAGAIPDNANEEYCFTIESYIRVRQSEFIEDYDDPESFSEYDKDRLVEIADEKGVEKLNEALRILNSNFDLRPVWDFQDIEGDTEMENEYIMLAKLKNGKSVKLDEFIQPKRDRLRKV